MQGAKRSVIQNTPDWTASGRLSYDRPIMILQNTGRLLVKTLVSYRCDSSHFDAPNPLLDQEAFPLIDAGLHWETEGGRRGFSLNGKDMATKRDSLTSDNFVTISPNGAFTPTLGLEGSLTAPLMIRVRPRTASTTRHSPHRHLGQ